MNLLNYILHEARQRKIAKDDAAGFIRELQARGAGCEPLHPLVHHNTSTLQEQRYSSRFTGQEAVLAQHRVQGRPVLPGVAYLEMAREALSRAGAFAEDAAGLRLTNVVWARPVVVDEAAVQVHIARSEEHTSELQSH